MQSPIPIESRALGTLAYIRTSIESSGSMAVPGMAGIVMGIIGIVATIVTSLSPLAAHWLPVWLVAGAIALIVGGAMMARQAAQSGHARYLGPVRKFLFCLCPALMAGAVLTLVLWHAGNTSLIPGVWLLLYGCAVLSASTVTIARTMRLICIMGCLFMLLGLLAFAAPAYLHTLILGMGFGALHSIFGVLIGHVSHGE
ncbi:MAG: hypothetical protein QOD56_2217 [Gammaproteobacteria bacterium]|jgi:uncharacterized membrane protein HdeD (DUF308 family)|nr:hypothetical protein [Gammaproteobacteria bacterium]